MSVSAVMLVSVVVLEMYVADFAGVVVSKLVGVPVDVAALLLESLTSIGMSIVDGCAESCRVGVFNLVHSCHWECSE